MLCGDQLELFPHTSVVRGKIYVVSSHGLYYFRYVANQGHQVLIQQTIPGGNVNSKLAQLRCHQVQAWIDSGKFPPQEIQRRIQMWKRKSYERSSTPD